MHAYRFAVAGAALVASTVLISCSSDDNDAPANSGAPVVADSTIATLPIADTSIDDTTDQTVAP
ncbi:MAG TPA: hypothetical protein VHQ23_17830 [Ilumatobacteraceae bacterium]|nr:hypothetical protein [Ilumatobacteraceae bacterium]